MTGHLQFAGGWTEYFFWFSREALLQRLSSMRALPFKNAQATADDIACIYLDRGFKDLKVAWAFGNTASSW